MRVLRRGVLRTLAGGLVPVLAAGTVLLSAGAAAAAPGSPRTAGPAPVPTSLSPSQIRKLEAMAARGAAAARIGWFLPADCKCSFANEAAFQKIMNGIFAAAASVNNMSVRSTPRTAIKLNRAQRSSRIPDIYYFRLNTAHPATGLGSINEFKVGRNTSQQLFQRYMDAHLLAQGHGLGANAFDRNQFLPVKQAVWWFVPKAGITYNNFTFITSLLARGINVIYLIDDPSAKKWPRTESKQRKAKDVKEIESNNQALARAGLTNLVGPCLMVCPVG